MTATSLIEYLTWIIYVTIFVVACVQYVRRPRRANLNIALFFGIVTFIIADQLLVRFELFPFPSLLRVINIVLLFTLPYVLLRLVDDFVGVRPALMRAVVIWFVLVSVASVVFQPAPGWVTIIQVLYFVGLQVYAGWAFTQASRHASGVTKRRLGVVALGAVALGLAIFAVSLRPFSDIWGILFQGLALASGVCYFLGFAPPTLLRRAWQEPELRAFLGRAAQLPRLPTTSAIIRSLEQGAATSLGVPNAAIGIWNSEANVLEFESPNGPVELIPTPGYTSGRAFLEQRALFVADAFKNSSDYTDVIRRYNAKVVLAAPITAGSKKLGVLTVYAAQTPIFAEDDLELVQLLADQAAVVLESRALIDEAGRVQAREEATRLKDDFLSAAAHDLKTPLTTIVGRAQLMERRTLREPNTPADLRSIQTIITEAQRLHALVRELLDASRAEHGQLLGTLSITDVTQLAQEACDSLSLNRHQLVVDADAAVVGSFDRIRLRQLLDNLLENAVKYSPEGGEVRVKVWQEDHVARLSVADQGIGIPANDLPHVFERFYRAKNVDDRQFAGMGLGLFICCAIVEQHGGRIWAVSPKSMGTTFHVLLPLNKSEKAQHV